VSHLSGRTTLVSVRAAAWGAGIATAIAAAGAPVARRVSYGGGAC
jgi:hypothetical protein